MSLTIDSVSIANPICPSFRSFRFLVASSGQPSQVRYDEFPLHV